MADYTFSQTWAPLLTVWLAQHRLSPVHTPRVRQVCCFLVRSTCPGTTSHQGSHEAFRPELPSVRPDWNTGQNELGFASTSQPMLWDSAQSIGKGILMCAYPTASDKAQTGLMLLPALTTAPLSSNKCCPSSKDKFTNNTWKVVHDKKWSFHIFLENTESYNPKDAWKEHINVSQDLI